jgi:hypothetical protein
MTMAMMRQMNDAHSMDVDRHCNRGNRRRRQRVRSAPANNICKSAIYMTRTIDCIHRTLTLNKTCNELSTHALLLGHKHGTALIELMKTTTTTTTMTMKQRSHHYYFHHYYCCHRRMKKSCQLLATEMSTDLPAKKIRSHRHLNCPRSAALVLLVVALVAARRS